MSQQLGVRHVPATLTQMASIFAGKRIVRHSVVSLFSGCGGMDLGFVGGFPFHRRYFDRLPFEIVWANDINKAACATYKANLQHEVHCGDIDDFMDTLPKRADVVIGGFPCQDVSINGKGKAQHGARSILYKSMIKVIRKVKPRAWVAENVKGVLSHQAFYEQMKTDFEALRGYRIAEQIYVASGYGVPQKRQRLFLIGMKGRHAFEHPAPELKALTAGEVLADLEEEPENAAACHVWSKAAASPEQGSRKLRKDEPATTIRAEHHGNIQWHYSQARRISLREAARLQSFPDAFQFTGGMRATERQIGNAVPPVLAWHIAKALRERLDAGIF